eukprot:5505103-Amphidinium_carterae.1
MVWEVLLILDPAVGKNWHDLASSRMAVARDSGPRACSRQMPMPHCTGPLTIPRILSLVGQLGPNELVSFAQVLQETRMACACQSTSPTTAFATPLWCRAKWTRISLVVMSACRGLRLVLVYRGFHIVVPIDLETLLKANVTSSSVHECRAGFVLSCHRDAWELGPERF